MKKTYIASSWRSALLPVLLAALSARADVVELNDGRRFEGKILLLTNERVLIDTKAADVRVKLGFPRQEVASVAEKELEPGFFEAPRTPPRASDPKKFSEDATLYLEVPVIGEVGTHIHAAGIAPVLQYAKAHGIGHLVFMVDSPGGDADEGVALYRLMRRYHKEIDCHAIVRQCRGAALGLVLWCDTIHLLPGGIVSGLEKLPTKAASKEAPEDEAVLRAMIANRVVSETGKSGFRAAIIRALFDNSEPLVVWRGPEGIEYGPAAPQGTPGNSIIIDAKPGQFLELTQAQFQALGMPPFQGEAKDLGAHLKLDGWTLESDYGPKTVTRVAVEKEKSKQAAQKVAEAKIEKNVARRQETNDYIEYCLQQAAKWDPRQGEYEKYSQHWGWGWGGTAVEWTEDSQKRWKTRTDGAIHHIKEALKGIRSVKKLDAEAVKLGLQPTFKPGEADIFIKDLEVKLVALATMRDRKG